MCALTYTLARSKAKVVCGGPHARDRGLEKGARARGNGNRKEPGTTPDQAAVGFNFIPRVMSITTVVSACGEGNQFLFPRRLPHGMEKREGRSCKGA